MTPGYYLPLAHLRNCTLPLQKILPGSKLHLPGSCRVDYLQRLSSPCSTCPALESLWLSCSWWDSPLTVGGDPLPTLALPPLMLVSPHVLFVHTPTTSTLHPLSTHPHLYIRRPGAQAVCHPETASERI